MAEVVLAARVSEQVALIAQLRWRQFSNSLRSWEGRLDLIALAILLVVAAVVATGLGLGLGVAAYLALTKGTPKLATLLWAVVACWQLLPLIAAGFASEVDLRILLRFPLRCSTYALLNLLNGLFDSTSVLALFWTLCIGVGVVLAQPRLLVPTLVVVLVFTAFNLFLNRLFLPWLEEILSRRRTREKFLVGVVLVFTSLQFLLLLPQDWRERARPWVELLWPVAQLLPPHLAAETLAGAARGDSLGWVATGALLVGYCAVLGFCLARRLRRQYAGHFEGEGSSPATAATTSVVQEGWHIPGLSTPLAALCEKELRYALRNGQTLLSLTAPLLAVTFFALGFRREQHEAAPFSFAPDLLLPLAVAYVLLALAPMFHNSFAHDGTGIQLLLAAPVCFESVLLAKNLVHGLLIFLDAGLVWLLVSLLLSPPAPAALLATLAALLFATLAHAIAGNLLSLYLPRPQELGRFRRRSSELSVLLGMLIQVAVLGLASLVFYKSRHDFGPRGLWIAAAIFLTLGLGAWTLYRALWQRFGQIALERRESLLNELCH